MQRHPTRCTHATTKMCSPLFICIPLDNVAFNIYACHIRCVHALTASSYHWPMLFSQRKKVMADGACHREKSISLCICTHATCYASIPLIMFHYNVWCRYLDANKTHLMREDLCWCALQFGDVALMMHILHDRCCLEDAHKPRLMHASLGWSNLSFVDVAWLMRQSQSICSSRCTHTMVDVWRYWMLLPIDLLMSAGQN